MRSQPPKELISCAASAIHTSTMTNGRHPQVERVKQLRQKAELFRQVARTPAGRDPLVDRDLFVLADRLDQQADEREEYLQRQAQS